MSALYEAWEMSPSGMKCWQKYRDNEYRRETLINVGFDQIYVLSGWYITFFFDL